MHVIITCKYEKYLIKNSREKVATAIFGPSSAGNSMKGSDLTEFRTHPSSYVCHRYLQV